MLGSGSQPGPPPAPGAPPSPPMRALVPGPPAQERQCPGQLPGVGTRPSWGGHSGVSPRLALVSSPPPLIFHLSFAPRQLGALGSGGPASLTLRGHPRCARSLFYRCTLYICRDLPGAPSPPPCSYPGVGTPPAPPPSRCLPLGARGPASAPHTPHYSGPEMCWGQGGWRGGLCRS